MRRSPALDSPRSSPRFDEYGFRRTMNDIGRAYRNQAIELIAICRLFVQAADQGFTQDAELTRVLQVCDLALERAVEARKGLSSACTESIKEAVRELHEYESTYHPINAGSTTNSVTERMTKAKQKDETSKKALLNRMLGKGPSINPASLVVVEFRLMGSLTDDQPTIVKQELTMYSKPQEVLWNFSRSGRNRLTLAKNPHFYHRLPPTSPDANWNESTSPIEHNWHTHPIYVLTNIPGRIFLECEPPKRRAFDNVWSINGALVFKDVCGKLWSESAAGEHIQDRPCFWCLVESPPQQPAPGPPVIPPIHPWTQVPDWREPIGQLLLSPDIKIRITENT